LGILRDGAIGRGKAQGVGTGVGVMSRDIV
jgi:hypothetical protein